ncbi:hypothetical protein EJ02DRAFT_449469 [Clathrospora elynae]|uniref:Uncharacterized protein n=1 Tax=Clathrospora elynae TaxID=706981 RepID=A0A6A5T7A1_9PLEO|nr:hypothetical protein EJ02DRAFT_449469 [Clathrospora elynae]
MTGSGFTLKLSVRILLPAAAKALSVDMLTRCLGWIVWAHKNELWHSVDAIYVAVILQAQLANKLWSCGAAPEMDRALNTPMASRGRSHQHSGHFSASAVSANTMSGLRWQKAVSGQYSTNSKPVPSARG